MKNFLSCFLIFCFLAYGASCRLVPDRDLYAIQKSSVSKKGMVVSAHPIASNIGLEILKQGGNAADAAIAVQLALAVVYPRAGNLGGGGFLVYRDSSGEVSTLDFRERAPLAAHRDMYLDSSGNVVADLSKTGILAVGIPGTVAGLVETHIKLGRLPWSGLVQPAIVLAENGFRITQSEANRLNEYGDVFRRHNPPDMPFLSKEYWQEGDLLVQKELAGTLRSIAERGQDGFYSGKNAKALVSLAESKNGVITLDDLASYKAIWRKHLSIEWQGYQIHTMNLPSSGGIVMSQILHMLEDKMIDSTDHHDVDNIHLVVEALRRAFAERAEHLGDVDFYPVPVDSILHPDYISGLFEDFNPSKATPSQYPDSVQIKLSTERFETTHLSIADGEGNAVSVTTTLNDNYGCKVWVPGGGYFLNNEMDDFSTKPGFPNMFGLIGAEANAIAPGKRMLSSMAPTIIEKDNELWMVLGSPGGPTIISSVLQVFLNVAVYKMDIDEAVQTGRYHHQWLPDVIMHEEDALPPNVIEELSSMGHSFRAVKGIGLIEAIMVKEGVLHGAADRRGDDHAAGW